MKKKELRKPDVILFITDDQGYGDLGCTGNPWLQTPEIDAFASQSVVCEDFHVSPLCTPTRGALMTGRRPLRNGAWGVCRGRALLGANETTMADIFAANGYRTGLFGKWHLGDNYPYRPTDRGFQKVVAHKGGGVGQTPDYWGNNYFDDTYFHNNQPLGHEGYCTDIWFDEAMAFLEQDRESPAFICLATNAPHDPYLVDDAYTRPYADNPDIPHPTFYGMIANLDENFGRLRRFLSETGGEDNTILIFLTDNGSSGGCRLDDNGYVTQGYNAGLRGKKGSYYEGGHRAPLFIRWPEGGLKNRSVEDMTLHIDLLPTLMDLCHLSFPDQGVAFDGLSIAPALRGKNQEELKDRVHFIQMDMASGETIEKWYNAVACGPWRLVCGKELYNLDEDPGQISDIADTYPEIVDRLRAAHEEWWRQIEPGIAPYEHVILGSPHENPTRLDAFDVHGDTAFVQSLVAAGKPTSGRWKVRFDHAGQYRFRLRRWPEELDLPIESDLSPEAMDRLIIRWTGNSSRSVRPVEARLQCFDIEHCQAVDSSKTEVVFDIHIPQAGDTELTALFREENDEWTGAWYVYVEALGRER